jgi:hypothetical protein
MGNCYGEDGDSEDEYYGYYGKNNRLKPQLNSTHPNPNPTLSEPDPHEFDHDDPNSPTPSEPDYHHTKHTNADHEDDVNDADWEDDEEHETESVGAYEYGTPGYKDGRGYRHGEWEFEAETEEHEEGVFAGGGYEHNMLEYEDAEKENRVYEPRKPERDNDETYELEELDHTSGEWRYEPQTLEYHDSGTLGTRDDTYRHDDGNNACGFTPNIDNVKPTHPVPTHTRPPTHVLHPRNVPHSNQ